jgi:hypothetical protein
MKQYVVGQSSWEYNDETYSSSDGMSPAFVTGSLEEAKKWVTEQTRDFYDEMGDDDLSVWFDTVQGGWGHDQDMRKCVITELTEKEKVAAGIIAGQDTDVGDLIMSLPDEVRDRIYDKVFATQYEVSVVNELPRV